MVLYIRFRDVNNKYPDAAEVPKFKAMKMEKQAGDPVVNWRGAVTYTSLILYASDGHLPLRRHFLEASFIFCVTATVLVPTSCAESPMWKASHAPLVSHHVSTWYPAVTCFVSHTEMYNCVLPFQTPEGEVFVAALHSFSQNGHVCSDPSHSQDSSILITVHQLEETFHATDVSVSRGCWQLSSYCYAEVKSNKLLLLRSCTSG